jgi:hypothetical protein
MTKVHFYKNHWLMLHFFNHAYKKAILLNQESFPTY